MNTLTVVVFACMVVLACAKPSLLWGAPGNHLPLVGASGIVTSGGAAGPTGLVNGHGAIGPNGIPNAGNTGGLLGIGIGSHGINTWKSGDDGQWHGEGLLESQDWDAKRRAIAGSHGLGLGLGLGLRLGHKW